jgi:hypothetical protein
VYVEHDSIAIHGWKDKNRWIDEGDFLQGLVSQNAILGLWPDKAKGIARTVDFVRHFQIKLKARI